MLALSLVDCLLTQRALLGGLCSTLVLRQTFDLEVLRHSQEGVYLVLSDADLPAVHEGQDVLEVLTGHSPEVDNLLVVTSSQLGLPAEDLSHHQAAG